MSSIENEKYVLGYLLFRNRSSGYHAPFKLYVYWYTSNTIIYFYIRSPAYSSILTLLYLLCRYTKDFTKQVFHLRKLFGYTPLLISNIV